MTTYKIAVIVFSVLLCSCALQVTKELPEAYLIVDGKKYEMASGTFCWGDFCSDSFAYTTEIGSVEIKRDSKIELYFKSRSKIKKAYLKSISTKFFESSKLPYDDSSPDDKQFAENFNRLYTIWHARPEYEEEVGEKQDRDRVELKPELRQELKNKYFDDAYIISVDSWWADGDISFDILVQGKS